jgi:D-alanyl-D-alanine carboxypeptidase
MLRRVVIATCFGAFAQAQASAGPAVLFDAATGEVLKQERAGEPWYPASLTKLMTAYIVFKKLRAGTLKLDQDIVVSPLAAAQEPSKIGVPAGRTIKLDLALQSMLVYSANDMAFALAENAGGGNVTSFVQEMNAEALKLGLSATHFVNPNGLFDPRQLISARDIGQLAAVLIAEFPEHQHYFSQPYVPIGKRRLANRNSLIRSMKAADGMKTGFVCNSGFNLVASATQNGRRLVAVVLGAKSSAARAIEAQKLLESGFAMTRPSSAARLSGLGNSALGQIVPADMTSLVCKQKPLASVTSARNLNGWGISFGTYADAQKADMALRGRLISAVGMEAPGKPGVVRMPDKSGFAAMLWGMDQTASESLCNAYHSQSAVCTVMPPATFASLAALAAKNEPPPQPQVAQGSDGQRPKAKSRKRVKKRLN